MAKAEILSPVGNRSMLEAAVRAGADAVYLGMEDFNARRNAENFDRSAFSEAVRYCHVRGVRVYLTLNTLVGDSELKRALDTALFAYQAGVDAVIVQDLGLARLLRENIPLLELHASTQMSIHSPAALPVLKELGFRQVVLAREMTREEIRDFCHAAREYDIRVEVFVHGALCMCLSGQCYFSAMLGGRSGNRGLCAGPCRLPFSSTGNEAYDLSLKDLSLVSHLRQLQELGVSSFKIEGRMKRPEYVAAATAVCRLTLEGRPCAEWEAALSQVFSRSGFTDGYFTGKRGSSMFGIRQKEDVLKSSAVLSGLHELYRTERQSVSLIGIAALQAGKRAVFSVTDGVHSTKVVGELVETARDSALTPDAVREKLSRTGNTPFYFENLSIVLDDNVFYPASRLNELRRAALADLEEKRGSSKRTFEKQLNVPEPALRKQKNGVLLARFSSLAQLPCDLSDLAAVVLPLEDEWERYDAAPLLLPELPRAIFDEARVLARLKEAKAHGVKAVFCSNLSALTLAREAGISAVADFGMNLYSRASFETAKSIGFCAGVASFEALAKQISDMTCDLPVGMIVYGHLPLMLTRNCPIRVQKDCKTCKKEGSLIDRRRVKFPVRCREGYSELFNSSPLWLADKADELNADFKVLYFTVENREECARVLDAYRKNLPASGEFTRGLYFRGVE